MNSISGGYIRNLNNSAVTFGSDYTVATGISSESCKIYLKKDKGENVSNYETKELHIILAGEIYRNSNEANLDYSKYNSFLSFVGNRYITNDLKSFLNKIDGIFNILIIDKVKNEICLITDRNGSNLLYLYLDSNMFLWSNSVSDIVRLFKNKNNLILKPASVKMFMEFGHLLGNQTYFENISLTNPASIYKYNLKDNTCKSNFYWTWNQIKPQKINFETATEYTNELFRKAIIHRFSESERIGVALSGGLDSRFILSTIIKNFPGYKGFLHTFGLKNCLDIKISKIISSQINWNHSLYFFDNLNLIEKREALVVKTDGMFDMKHMHGLEFIDDIKKNIDINFNGYAGELILGGNYLKSKSILNQRVNENTAGYFYKEFAIYSELNSEYINTNHLDPFILMNRGRRMANIPMHGFADSLIQRAPYIDNNLIDFVYSLPDEYRFKNKLYFNVLLKYHADLFKNIPWQFTELPINKEYSIKHNLLKYTNKLISKTGIRKQYRNYIDYVKYLEESDIKPMEDIDKYFRKLTLHVYFKQLGFNNWSENIE